MKKILLGVTGGIGAYKSLECARLLRELGFEVKVVMTKHAQEFVTPLSFQAMSCNPVYARLFDETSHDAMRHIELAKWADSILLAPASANTIAKIALGLADDLLTTICLASKAKLFVAPAMNKIMFENSATQNNIQTLIDRGATIIGPDCGLQACGDVGFGRMGEPDQIVAALNKTQSHFWQNKKIVITAGPTHEAIDPIRFISNKSSGKMGYALAEAAAQLGAQVILISGPTHLSSPKSTVTLHVTTATEMLKAVLKHSNDTDIFIGAAAVANYKIENPEIQKIKSVDEKRSLLLIKNQDIIYAVSRLDKKPFIVGFAAETQNLHDNAFQKLRAKNMDLIVANDVSENQVMGCDTNRVIVINKKNEKIELPEMPKKILASRLLDIIGDLIK